MTENTLDEEALVAAVDLVGRTGATDVTFGWLNDPGEHAYERRGPQCYAHAQYRGARVTVEDFPDLVAVVEALADRLMRGAKCAWCGNAIVLPGVPDDVVGVRFNDGSKLGVCRWERTGARWDRTCTASERVIDINDREKVGAAVSDWTRTLDGATAIRQRPNRAARRAQRRGRR